MKARIQARPYRLALSRPLATAAGVIAERRGFWILAEDEEGRTGLGEAAPLPRFGTETVEEAARFLAGLEGWRTIEHDLTAAPLSSRAGLDLARLDLEAQRAGVSLADHLSPRSKRTVSVNALLRTEEPEDLAAEAADAAALGYGTLKMKIGAREPADDARRFAAVRRRLGPGIRLRADANRAWEAETALHALRLLEPFGLEFVEEPARAGIEAIARVSPVPICADESVCSIETGRRLITERSVPFLSLKPSLIGGISAARRLAEEAHEAGIGVVITSALDTSVGVAGALHLAASLPWLDRACGLATAGLLAGDPAEGLEAPSEGFLRVPQGPGLGVRLGTR